MIISKCLGLLCGLSLLLSGYPAHGPRPALLPTVAFALDHSSGDEAQAEVSIDVVLSAPADVPISAAYRVEAGMARGDSSGSGQDYRLDAGRIVFEPGTTRQSIRLAVIDDTINETDESLSLELYDLEGAAPGTPQLHRYTILDNDRKLLADVTAYGAVGDGVTDDSAAIQAAVDAVYRAGGGVVVFPPRAYSVISVKVRDNVTLYGYGAALVRPPHQGEWTRTFDTTEEPYAGVSDSRPLIIQGFTFDGNSQNQGPYQDHQLEHAALIFLHADPQFPGRLVAVVEDCTFQNGVADAISVYTNVAITVHNSRATNVYRGGFVLTGGYSTARVTQFFVGGDIDPTGIDIEVDREGYGGSFRVDIEIDGLYLANGDLDIAIHDGSTLLANHVISDDGPFFLSSMESRVRFSNCRIKVGASDSKINRILLPHDVQFENCDLIATRKKTARPYSHFAVADVYWQRSSIEEQHNESLKFINTRFLVDDNLRSSDPVYAIYSRSDARQTGNTLIVEGGCISNAFDQWSVVESHGVRPQISAVPCEEGSE